MSDRDRILVVDDERHICNLLSEVLTDEGFQVETACDGNAAIKLLQEKSFDLLMTDIKMPSMDGISLSRWVDKNCDLPVIILTGYPSEETSMEALRSGVADYLVKPFDINQIVLVIRRTLNRSRLRAQARRLNDALDNEMSRLAGPEADAASGHLLDIVKQVSGRVKSISAGSMASLSVSTTPGLLSLLKDNASLLGIKGALLMQRGREEFVPVESFGLSDKYTSVSSFTDEIYLAAQAGQRGGEVVMRDLAQCGNMIHRDLLLREGVGSVYCYQLGSPQCRCGAGVVYGSGSNSLQGTVKRVIYLLLEQAGLEMRQREYLSQLNAV
ncbi:MAG: response regulator [bacterium]|nr:response regulator [bacterium]